MGAQYRMEAVKLRKGFRYACNLQVPWRAPSRFASG
jgi:hypothetical protein